MTIPTEKGPNVTLEVNWSSGEGQEKYVKINGESIILMRELYTFLMLAGDIEIQEGLMPVQQKEVQHIIRQHNIRLEKDMKKGTMLKIPCEISVEKSVVEGLAGLMGKTEKVGPKSTILLPK